MSINDNSRNMHGVSFQGATFNGNSNIQSDNNTQTFQSGTNTELDSLFAQLTEEIKNSIKDDSEQQDNLDDLDKMKEAAVSGNKERITKFFGRLGKGIQVSSAGVALAKNLGILNL